jgi:hypothetical protein
MLAHPGLQTCEDCHTWLYSDAATPVLRAGQRVKRPAGSSPPCKSCPKSGDGKPHPERELSDKNWQAWKYYLEIKAGAPMPDDRTVRRNCAIIRLVEDRFERNQFAVRPLASALARALGR